MDSTEKKRTEVTTELNDWLQKPNAKSFYHDAPITQVTQTLTQPKLPKSLLVDLKLLNTWYGHHFIYNTLTGTTANGEQSDAAGVAYYTAAIASVLAQGYPGNPPKLQFTEMTYWLAQTLHARWYEQGAGLLKSIDRELDTKFLHGGENFNKAGWFIVQVANNGYEVIVDYTKYKYPREMGVYKVALEAWDTTDMAVVDRIVSTLCDYHLSEANFSEDKFYEFSFINEYVYVYEVLAWLSVREMRRLPNPAVYSHPLMQLPVNRLPAAPLPFKSFPLGEQALGRLKTEFPQAEL